MTVEELFAMPEADRVDQRLIAGRLVERTHPYRSPAHSGTVATLSAMIGNWARKCSPRQWHVHGYGCAYRLERNPDTMLCYDLSIIPQELSERQEEKTSFIEGIPTLGVEVIDFADSQEQVLELVEVSLSSGVPCIWVIDPVAEWIEIHYSNQERQILSSADELTDPELPGFRCAVAEIFE